MEFRRYLRLMGKLYFEGAVSDFQPDTLKRFGGSLAICAKDVEHIRFDPNSMLGLQRRMQDRWTAAEIGWRRHVSEIQTLLNAGSTPTETIHSYCARFQTAPHRPQQLEQALSRTMMANGNQTSAWKVATLQSRQRFQRGNAVMRDTFGAIGTMCALAITADNWQRATPQEWDRALNFGDVARAVGELRSVHSDARQQRLDTNQLARSAP